jgi:hypothetical protein
VDHRWYGPDESWPQHGLPWWVDALEVAREAGWHLITFSGHTWGKVVCSRDVDDPHQKVIFSTGRASERVARDLPKLVLRCNHPRDGDWERLGVRLVQARQLLDGAALLLDAAESCLRSGEKATECEELLRLAEGQVGAVEGFIANRAEDPDELLERAVIADQAAQQSLVEAYAQAEDGGYPAGRAVVSVELVSTAEARVETAVRVLADPPYTEDSQALQTTVGRLRDRVGNVRVRLARLRE